MSFFRLYMWREWREHRFALLALAGVLPFVTGLGSLLLSRRTLGDPVFQGAVVLGFVLVALVAVVGELLGGERRGNGMRWLERLPAGLAQAFQAKLAFAGLVITAAAAVGLATGVLVARLRGAPDGGWGGTHLVLLAFVWSSWTFSASAWTQRGGLALLGALLVLLVLALPVWQALECGYRPDAQELGLAIALLVPGALLGAWAGFVHGARFGRGTPWAAALGGAPLVPLLALSAGWSALRLGERERFDPYADDFELSSTTVSPDGRFALALGQHELPRWDSDKLPMHAVRIDLAQGTAERIATGTFLSLRKLEHEDEHGLPVHDALLLTPTEGDPLVLGLEDGRLLPWDRSRRSLSSRPKGLGFYLSKKGAGLLRDPFRGRDFAADLFAARHHRGTLLVRPGRWLFAPSPVRWHWLDPETRSESAVDWPEWARPLVLLEDGGILRADPENGLSLVHPEEGRTTTLDTRGIEAMALVPNPNGARLPLPSGDHERDAAGEIVLRGPEGTWLVLDAAASRTWRLTVPPGSVVLARTGGGVIVRERLSGALARLDLVSGARTRLFGPRGEVDKGCP